MVFIPVRGGQKVASTGLDRPGDLLRYPSVGTAKVRHYPEGTNNDRILYLGAGVSGVVRYFRCSVIPAAAELRIYCDAGNIADTDAPNSAYLTARIPLQNLLGTQWYRGEPTHAITRDDGLVQLSYDTFGLELDIPFSNGILIHVVNGGSLLPVDFGYIDCEYELGPLPVSAYSSWRLRASNWPNPNLATLLAPGTIIHDESSPYDDTSIAKYLNVSGSPGMLVGDFASTNNPLDWSPGYQEANPRMVVDTVASEWSGSEDKHSPSMWYYQQFGGYIAPYNGCTYRSRYNSKVSYYRIWRRPPVWTDSMELLWASQDTGMPSVDAIFTALYYGP